ncbi:hypothetical protein R69746_05799 [Paraburkholderia aspalathi]|uniref:hypothetical protein n=1 Tax=Paraburkholderia aspalathi TaxID=1324617 RepID=UPI00190B5F7F|nr:hypothetical protein [Paraburkholderia aspalathi]MBK3841843.1 hypothetical protein [Paraburkholderia aspalathi]CAE6815094.1 hypothetical protein R69746_05799 [Paraburkholderia aspalathi]
MATNLSPICKALIALFAGIQEPLTIDDVEAALPHADRQALRADLHLLVCATVVRQAIRRADERLVYWLAGVTIAPFDGTLFHYAPDATFADIGDIPSTGGTYNG